jgi:nicotinamidase-related amidase
MKSSTLDPDDLVVVFADLQEGIVHVAATADPQRLRRAVAALTDLSIIFGLPAIASCVPTTGGTVAPLLSEITTRLPLLQPLVRTTPGVLDDAAFTAALMATGRRTIIVAGVATEVAVRLAVTAAVANGMHAIVAVDACGGLDARSESAAFTELCRRGIELSAVATIAAELAGDFGSERGRAAMRALQSTLVLPEHDRGDHAPHS